MVHLGDGELLAIPGASAVGRNRDVAVVPDDHTVAVGRVDPHVVVVAARRLAERHVHRGRSAVERFRERRTEEIRFVVAVGGHGHAGVVGLAARQLAVVGDDAPRLAAVVRAPQLAVVGRLAVPRHAVAGLDQSIDAARVARRDGEPHLAERLQREAVGGELRPRGAAVARRVDPAPRPAALPAPGVDLDLPHPGEENPRVGRVHDDVRRAGTLVHEQHPLPGLPAVRRAVDPPLLLRPVAVPQRGDVDDVRIAGVDDDAGDAACVVEPHVLPGLAGIGGLVDPVADRDVAADPCFPCAGPHDVGVGRGDGERTDRLHRLVIEDRLPVHAAVGGFPDAARGRPGVVDALVARDAGDRGHAISHGADVAVLELGERGRIRRPGRRHRLRLRSGGWGGPRLLALRACLGASRLRE